MKSKNIKKIEILIILFIYLITTNQNCKKEQVPIKEDIIKESELVSRDLFVQRFDIYSPLGKLAPGEVFDGYISISCPEFRSDVSLNMYLIDSIPERISDVTTRFKYKIQIFPSNITCTSMYSSNLTFYVPEDVSPARYFALAQFTLNATMPIPITSEAYIIKTIDVIQKWKEYYLLSRYIKQTASIKITNVVDSKIDPTSENPIRIFAVSQDRKLHIINFFPQNSSFEINSLDIKMETAPNELNLIELKSGKLIIINDENRKNSEIIKLENLSVSYSHIITGYINNMHILEGQDGIYLISQNCNNSLLVRKDGVSELNIPTCDIVGKKQDSIIIFNANKITIISANNPTTSFIIPDPDYILETENEYTIYVVSGISIDTYILSQNGAEKSGSINMIKAPVFSEYLPVSKRALLLLFRYSDSATVYVWTENQEIKHQEIIHNPESYQIITKGGKTLVSFQRGQNKKIFVFDSENIVGSISGKIDGEIVDFIADQNKITIFVKTSNRLMVYSYDSEKNSLSYLFTQNLVERYKIIGISSETYIIFYTDSSGCWENRVCKGREIALSYSNGFYNENAFFTHTYQIHQKLTGIMKSGGRVFFIIQDLDQIRIFSF
ncbi:MAG: hypothetical protein NZ927_03440 [Candidatus Calescibacterium sp.]|nr:hypothetical protein [Candidatus Calescibacterium sp.]MDW8087787.1 hypothetical protein [Candidatus Calescibacterium sp.]